MATHAQRNLMVVLSIPYRAAITVLAMFCIADTVSAQWVGTPWDPRSPYITDAELARLLPALELLEEQDVIFRAFIDDWRAEVAESIIKWNSIRKHQNENSARTDLAPDERSRKSARLMRQNLECAEAALKKREQLDTTLLALLEPHQFDAWKNFLRDRRRTRSLRTEVRFAHQRVDLVALAEAALVESESHEKAYPILKEYKDRLDSLLIKSIRFIYDSRVNFYETIIASNEGTSNDPLQLQPGDLDGLTASEVQAVGEDLRRRGIDRAIKQERPHYEVAKKIADLKKLYTSLLAGYLSPDKAQEFRDQVERWAFSKYYGTRRAGTQHDFNAHRFINALESADGLTEEQASLINTIAQSYFRQFDILARKLARVQAKEEEEWEDRIRGQLDPSFGEENAELLTKRKKLQETTISLLKAVLTLEQRDALKAQRNDRGW